MVFVPRIVLTVQCKYYKNNRDCTVPSVPDLIILFASGFFFFTGVSSVEDKKRMRCTSLWYAAIKPSRRSASKTRQPFAIVALRRVLNDFQTSQGATSNPSI